MQKKQFSLRYYLSKKVYTAPFFLFLLCSIFITTVLPSIVTAELQTPVITDSIITVPLVLTADHQEVIDPTSVLITSNDPHITLLTYYQITPKDTVSPTTASYIIELSRSSKSFSSTASLHLYLLVSGKPHQYVLPLPFLTPRAPIPAPEATSCQLVFEPISPAPFTSLGTPARFIPRPSLISSFKAFWAPWTALYQPLYTGHPLLWVLLMLLLITILPSWYVTAPSIFLLTQKRIGRLTRAFLYALGISSTGILFFFFSTKQTIQTITYPLIYHSAVMGSLGSALLYTVIYIFIHYRSIPTVNILRPILRSILRPVWRSAAREDRRDSVLRREQPFRSFQRSKGAYYFYHLTGGIILVTVILSSLLSTVFYLQLLAPPELITMLMLQRRDLLFLLMPFILFFLTITSYGYSRFIEQSYTTPTRLLYLAYALIIQALYALLKKSSTPTSATFGLLLVCVFYSCWYIYEGTQRTTTVRYLLSSIFLWTLVSITGAHILYHHVQSTNHAF